MAREKRVEFGPCCLCGESIEKTGKDPCRVTVETAAGAWQVWYCHAACFREHLVDDPMLAPAHF